MLNAKKAAAERRRLTGETASTTALEDYLVTIYKLEETFGYARTTLIAKELGVKPATVSKILSKLEAEGYIVREKYKGARLTDKGREIAERIVWKHRVVERFLYEYVGLDPIKAHKYAHMLEHLPDEIVEKIYEKLGRPGACPLGNPIPGSDNIPEELKRAIRLSDLKENSCGHVVRLTMAVHEWGCWLIRMGIFIGRRICVEYAGQSHFVVRLDDGGKLEIPIQYTRLVYVLPDQDSNAEPNAEKSLTS
jgi:DtxR family Mn-dependent transcriptional regulator